MAWIYFCVPINSNWFLKSWCLMHSEKSDLFTFCCGLKLSQFHRTIVELWRSLSQQHHSVWLRLHSNCLLLSFLCLYKQCPWPLVTTFAHSILLPGFSWTSNSIIAIIILQVEYYFLAKLFTVVLRHLGTIR